VSDKSDTPEGQLIRDRRHLMSPEPNLEEMGARFGWSGGKWGNIERGRARARNGHPGRVHHPTAADLARIAAEMGISPEELEGASRKDAAGVLRGILGGSIPAREDTSHDSCDELIGKLLPYHPRGEVLELLWRMEDGDAGPRDRRERVRLMLDTIGPVREASRRTG
jgi:hypothetical protein